MNRSELMEMVPNEKRSSEDRMGNERRGRHESPRHQEPPRRQSTPERNGTWNHSDDPESARERKDSTRREAPAADHRLGDTRSRRLLRIATTCLSSHAVLCALVACYGLLGAVVFQALEAEYEVVVRERGTRLRSEALASMWNATGECIFPFRDERIRGVVKRGESADQSR